MNEEALINKAIAMALADADLREEVAGQAGEAGDRGAGMQRRLIAAYQDGRFGQTPEFLAPFLLKAQRQADPEYQTYIRLCEKFGGAKP